MSALDDASTAIQTAIDALATSQAKATADIAKSFADLQAAIKNGVDPTAAIASLGASLSKLQAANTAMQSLDASAIAADPNATPPPAA